ncbi:MAG: helix-turn-helix domain-containing protein [bacterium]
MADRQLGLSAKESLVYYALLKAGDVGTSKIAEETGLHSQFIYNSLETLMEKGLVEKYLQNRKTRYSAKDPQIFYEQIEKNRKTATLLNEAIKNDLIATIDEKSVQIFKGNEAFVNNELSLLKEMPSNTEILVIGGPGDDYLKQMGSNVNQYEYSRNKKNIKVRYIGNEAQKKYLTESADGRKGFDYRYVPGNYEGVMNISIHRNTAVTIYLFQNPVSMIIIRNKKIIDSYAEFFEALWSVSKK